MELISRDEWRSNRTTQLLALVMSHVLRLSGQTRKYEKPYLKQSTVSHNTVSFKLIVNESKVGYTLVTLPRILTPYRDSVDETRGRVTYQKLVTR